MYMYVSKYNYLLYTNVSTLADVRPVTDTDIESHSQDNVI